MQGEVMKRQEGIFPTGACFENFRAENGSSQGHLALTGLIAPSWLDSRHRVCWTFESLAPLSNVHSGATSIDLVVCALDACPCRWCKGQSTLPASAGTVSLASFNVEVDTVSPLSTLKLTLVLLMQGEAMKRLEGIFPTGVKLAGVLRRSQITPHFHLGR